MRDSVKKEYRQNEKKRTETNGQNIGRSEHLLNFGIFRYFLLKITFDLFQKISE
jgi:hypothetical protein